jgi:hypothetical protein
MVTVIPESVSTVKELPETFTDCTVPVTAWPLGKLGLTVLFDAWFVAADALEAIASPAMSDPTRSAADAPAVTRPLRR